MSDQTTKARVLADETLFQQACSRFVERNVIYCVSSLMYDVGQNREECSRIFDFDCEEGFDWFQGKPDYEEALDQNELRVFEYDGTWYYAKEELFDWEKIAEFVKEHNEYVAVYADDGETIVNQDDMISVTRFRTPAEALGFLETEGKAIILGLEAMYEPDDEYEAMEQACDIHNIDVSDYCSEIYEHWIVDPHFARELESRGHVVFEFAAMTIWGRPTTGQAISLDGVVRAIVRDMSEHAYVWSD